MKILLDESLPRKLSRDFGPYHEVWTVRDMGWLGQKNGALIRLMVENGFDALVTVDRNLPYQQNLQRLPISVFVLRAHNNRLDSLQALVPKLLQRLASGSYQNVNEIFPD
jgi:predicted nuclease of predicted toxin-antitoxin system